MAAFTLAHLSDPHLPPLPAPRLSELAGKRVLGYLNWTRNRRKYYRREVLDALVSDMQAQGPDHVAMTGDVLNLAIEAEYAPALKWLESVGPPDRVTAIPGNHDAYVRLHPERGTRHWQPYMESNEAGELLVPTPPTLFPFVRRFGDVALVALSSAIPTMPFIAAGKVGSLQRDLLGEALTRLGREGLFRVVLIHHPPLPGQAGWYRGLRDAGRTTRVMKQNGVELVLHGHNHEQTVFEFETVSGPAVVVGVPSASEAVEGRLPAARYNEYSIARVDGGFRCEMVGRAVADVGEHIWECERRVLRER